jgi:hypothetical protein
VKREETEKDKLLLILCFFMGCDDKIKSDKPSSLCCKFLEDLGRARYSVHDMGQGLSQIGKIMNRAATLLIIHIFSS